MSCLCRSSMQGEITDLVIHEEEVETTEHLPEVPKEENFKHDKSKR